MQLHIGRSYMVFTEVVLWPKLFCILNTVWYGRQMNGSLNVFNRNLTIICIYRYYILKYYHQS